MVDAIWGLPESAHFVVRDAPQAGRGVFARKALSAGDHLLTTSPQLSPTAHVVLRPYRREACAYCFSYDRGREWKNRVAGTALAFCTDDCRSYWIARYGEDALQSCVAVESCIQKHLKHNDDTDMEERFFDAHGAADMWKQATLVGDQLITARMARKPSKEQKRLIRSHSEVMVDPDILSFLLSVALIASYAESTSSLRALEGNSRVYETASLDEHIKAYYTLLAVLPVAALASFTSDLCHEYVSRASHNAFSIRPTADGDHSGEFLGYGVWPEASFFNHSCQPNVRKERIGRQWTFSASQDVVEGDELCITYLGGEEKDLDVIRRREKLRDEWGFICYCKRCVEEGGS
jgi:hypothetical protein